MSVATKLLGFGGLLAVVFAVALGFGRAVGPVASAPASHEDMAGGHEGMDMGAEGTGASFPKGLLVSQDGYTFRLAEPTAAAGDAVPVEAFWTDAGRAERERDPGRFRLDRLLAVRDSYSG